MRGHFYMQRVASAVAFRHFIPTADAPIVTRWRHLSHNENLRGVTRWQKKKKKKKPLTGAFQTPLLQEIKGGYFLTITKIWRWAEFGRRCGEANSCTASPTAVSVHKQSFSFWKLYSLFFRVIMKNMATLDPWMWQIGSRLGSQLWTITNSGWNAPLLLLSGMCIIALCPLNKLGGKDYSSRYNPCIRGVFKRSYLTFFWVSPILTPVKTPKHSFFFLHCSV